MTRERRAIDTTTASTSSFSLFLSVFFFTGIALYISRYLFSRRSPSSRRDGHAIFRDVVRRSVNWLKCTEISKSRDVGGEKGAILSTWLETCKFLAKVGQTLRVGSISTVDFFLRLVIYSVAAGKFRTVTREPRGGAKVGKRERGKLVSPSIRRENLLGRCTCNAR